MASEYREPFEQLRDLFIDTWNSGERPWILEYLNKVPPEDRAELARILIPIDIDCRLDFGERPRPNDYFQLGLEAFGVAVQYLTRPIQSRQTEFGNSGTLDEFPHQDETTRVADEDLCPSKELAPNDFVGPYRLLNKIGRGGMGTVWMAEQREPVRRHVAIKVIRSDVNSQGAIGRFEAERQALAMMSHENIAKVLDAGTTVAGAPFFVMELFNGMRLDEFCDEHQLTLRDRLELVLPVCRAVQHAHQKGIIHRDLKPSNVLVSEIDGKYVPKVIDFGLAKAIGHQNNLSENTLTEFGKVVGTIRYMSPEQAAMGTVDVDTRTDVYSLGVIIYKMMTGTTPLEKKSESNHSLMNVLDCIQNVEPARPSTQFDVDSDRMRVVCANRASRPEHLKQFVRGDLDWIVMKALEIDRSDRYETANGLAKDIERFLNDEAIAARPPTTSYRIQKFVKRNRKLVASAVLICLLLVAGIAGTTWGMLWAFDERYRANQKSLEAEISASMARRSERHRSVLQSTAEAQLKAIRLKSAWSDWQLGNVETAWEMLRDVSHHSWGWESRYLLREFVSHKSVLYGHALRINAIARSPDGNWLMTGGDDNTLKIWDLKKRKLQRTLKVDGAVTDIRFSKGGKWFGSADRSNRVNVWKLDGWNRVHTYGPYAYDISCFEFLPNSEQLLVALESQDTLRPRGERAAVDQASPMILLVDPGGIVRQLAGHQQKITDIVAASETTFFSASLDQTIRHWKLEDEDSQGSVFGKHNLGATDLSLGPDGKYLASSGLDSTVRLWQIDSRVNLETYAGHREKVNSVEFSRNGRQACYWVQ